MKTVLVIVPTYNEAANILPLLNEIFKVFRSSRKHVLEVLVVDDSSPDGTAGIVRKLQKTNKNIHLITGKKEGLGKAYIRGLKYGLKKRHYDIFVMMDADFSHDPKAIPSLLKSVDSGTDYAIGSRYVKGGRVSGWPTHRKVSSHIANLVARTFLDMEEDIRDLTGGFKAMHGQALHNIDLDSLRASGYVFQVNLLHEFSRRGFVIREVPITFADRQYGQSKMRPSDVLEFIYLTYRLNPNSRPRRIIRFAFVGASGTVVNVAALISLVNWLSVPVIAAGAIAIEISIISNFFLNHFYTFRAAYTSPRTTRRDSLESLFIKLFKYNLITLGGAAISFTVFATTYQWLGLNYILADLLAILIAMTWNYWMSVRIVWKIIDE